MKVLFFYLLISMFVTCSSPGNNLKTGTNCKSTYDGLTGLQIYKNVEVAPEYPGGPQERLLFFSKNFRYPNQDVFQGKVELEFIIDSSGKLVGERIRNKSMELLT